MSTSLLFVIVGRNEPLFEAEIHPRTTTTTAASSTDAVSRQNYFVLHSALDLVDKAAWNSSQMYLKVVDKVRFTVLLFVFLGKPIFKNQHTSTLFTIFPMNTTL